MRNFFRRFCQFLFVALFFTGCDKPQDVLTEENDDITGVIYATYGNKLFAFDLEKQKVIWENSSAAGIVTYDNDFLYVHTALGVEAINNQDGTTLWTIQQGGVGTGQHTIGGRPIIQDSLLYYTGDGGLYCVNKRNGQLIWKKQLQPASSGETYYGVPLIVKDKIIAIGHNVNNPRNFLHCFDRITGNNVWFTDELNHRVSPFPFTPDSIQVIFGSGFQNVVNDGIYSFNIETGEKLWSALGIAADFRSTQLSEDKRHMYLVDYTRKWTSTFNLTTKTQENVHLESIQRSTFMGEKFFYETDFLGIKCRNIYSSQVLWSIDFPFKEIWLDSDPFNLNNSYSSNLIADDKYVYHFEHILDTPNPPEGSSFFIFSQENGELLKEIKWKEGDPLPGKHILLVKNGRAYYSTRDR